MSASYRVHSAPPATLAPAPLLLDRRRGEELQGEGPQRVEGEHVLPHRGHGEVAVGGGARVRPVLVALDLAALEEVSDHDDDLDLLLHHHPPEGVLGVLHGPLGGDVGAAPPEAVHVVGVEVLVLVLGLCPRPALPQPHPGVVN